MTDTRVLNSAVYEALAAYANDLVALINADGTVRYASPSYRRILGYDPEALTGTNLLSRTHPDDVRSVRQALHALLDSTEPITVRVRIRHADGSYRVLSATGANHLDDPVVHGIVVNSRDITDRVQAVERLRRQEARYRRIVESTLDSLVVTEVDGTIVEANDIAHDLYGYDPGELIGRSIFDIMDPEWRSAGTHEFERMLKGEVIAFEGLCNRKDGGTVWIEGRGALLVEDDHPLVLSMARSITERVRSFELLEQRVEERTRELTTLLDVARTISSTLDLETLLSLVLDALQRLVGYDGASISVVDQDDLVIVVGRPGFGQERPATRRVPLRERSDIWYLVAEGSPLLIDDVLGDAPLARRYREAAAAAGYGWDSSFRSWLGVPLQLKDHVVGVLSLVQREAGRFTEHHVELVSAVTRQTAVAIENVQLYARAQEAAVLEERQRLSRELHDSVSQVLYSVGLGSKTARALVERDPKRAIDALEFTLAQAERGLAEMRALIFELRPESLEQEGLIAAVHRQVVALRARYGTDITLDETSEPQVSLPVKEALYRIAQEALHNTFKHAGATEVNVSIREDDSGVILEVRDNGRGLDPNREYPGHLGLQSMRERANRVGGQLEIVSSPGAGALVRAIVPPEI